MFTHISKILNSVSVPTKLSKLFEEKKSFQILGKVGIHRTLTYLKLLSSYLPNNRIQSTLDYLANSSVSSIFTAQNLLQAPLHGALIIVPQPEMLYSTYTLIRELSPELNAFRINNISDTVALTKLMSEINFKDLKKKYGENFKQKSMNWNVLDVAIATPSYLSGLFAINPEFVVLDSCSKKTVNEFKTRFAKSKIITVNCQDLGLGYETVELEYAGKTKVVNMTGHSIYDLKSILEGKDSKIVIFTSSEPLLIAVKLFQEYYRILVLSSNRKTAYCKILTKAFPNVFAVESDIYGLDLPFEKWVFFGTDPADAKFQQRTYGENIFFLKSQS